MDVDRFISKSFMLIDAESIPNNSVPIPSSLLFSDKTRFMGQPLVLIGSVSYFQCQFCNVRGLFLMEKSVITHLKIAGLDWGHSDGNRLLWLLIGKLSLYLINKQ